MEGITPLTYAECARKLLEGQVHFCYSPDLSPSLPTIGGDSTKKFDDFVVFYDLAMESLRSSFNTHYQLKYDKRVWEWIYHPVVSIIITSYLNISEDLDNWINDDYPPLVFAELDTPTLQNYNELHAFLTSDYGQQYVCEYLIANKSLNIHISYSPFIEETWKYEVKKPTVIRRFYRSLQMTVSNFSRFISLVHKKDEYFSNRFEFNHFFSNIFRHTGFTYVFGTGFSKILVRKRNSELHPFCIKNETCLSGLLNTLIPKEYGIDNVLHYCVLATRNTHIQANRLHLQDIFVPLDVRIRIAISQAKGSSVYIYQHGGAYKVLKYHYHEFVERRLSNKWISAGSLRSVNSHYDSSSIVYAKFNVPLRSSSSFKVGGPICIQLYDISKHEAFINSEMNSRLMPHYLWKMRELKENMPISVKVVVQYYHQKLAYFPELERIFKSSKFSFFELGSKTEEIRSKVSLMILTYFSTTILEEISGNKPFVILVPCIEAYTEEIYPLLLDMAEVNLLFINPKKLCTYIEDRDWLSEFYGLKTQKVVNVLREKLIISGE